MIDADATQMRQLFQNLISNGLKFHRDGVDPVVRVDGGHEYDGNGELRQTCCKLEIADNGIGFEEKYSERIFEVFQRIHHKEQYEGTGIGLAVCKKIVKRHKGKINARSVPDKGTVFTITLPVDQVKE